MEKRIFIAVMVSIAFLWAWGYLVPKLFPEMVQRPQPRPAETATAPEPTPGRDTTATMPSTAAPQQSPSRPAPVAAERIEADREITTVIDQPTYRATFRNRGAQLVSFRLKNYLDADGGPLDLVKPRDPSRTDFPFTIETVDPQLSAVINDGLFTVEESWEGSARILRYRLGTAEGVVVEKVFRLTDEYRFDFEIAVRGREVAYRMLIGPGVGEVRTADDSQFIVTGNGAYQVEGSFDALAREKAPTFKVIRGALEFIGLEDNYFLTALIPATGGEGIFRSARFAVEGAKEPRKDLYAGVNAVGGRVAGKAYFGPKKAEILESYGLERALKLGVFGFIARLLLTGLLWLHDLTRNYGWAIVILTVIIKILLYPLQHKSIVSMKRMQQVQPKVNAIKDKYKKAKTDAEQRQKMNQEMMKLYQQEGINPMSGCLPILLQLPILWAFYSLLSNAIELRGADFMLWINDLSVRDPYYITPILMTATMFIQQWLTPTTVDPAQRRIFLMMPLIFGFIFKDFPSGLVLYWLVQNILSILQQLIMNKYWKEHPVELRTVKER
jgi:YidC/Oxa1 family membrane protein insertase